jgi:hypothetical protein
MTNHPLLHMISVKYITNLNHTSGIIEISLDSKLPGSLENICEFEIQKIFVYDDVKKVFRVSDVAQSLLLDILASCRSKGWKIATSNAYQSNTQVIESFFFEIDVVSLQAHSDNVSEKHDVPSTNSKKESNSADTSHDKHILGGGTTSSMIKQLAQRRKLNNNSLHPVVDGDKTSTTDKSHHDEVSSHSTNTNNDTHAHSTTHLSSKIEKNDEKTKESKVPPPPSAQAEVKHVSSVPPPPPLHSQSKTEVTSNNHAPLHTNESNPLHKQMHPPPPPPPPAAAKVDSETSSRPMSVKDLRNALGNNFHVMGAVPPPRPSNITPTDNSTGNFIITSSKFLLYCVCFIQL